MSHGISQGSEAETMKARLGATRTDHSCVPTKKNFALFSSTKMNAIIHPQEKSMDIDVIGIIYPACICQTKPQELLSIWKREYTCQISRSTQFSKHPSFDWSLGCMLNGLHNCAKTRAIARRKNNMRKTPSPKPVLASCACAHFAINRQTKN
jgi:hypothetical protein